MITGIHHVAINTSDIERMLKFYCDVIGFELVDRGEWQDEGLVDATIGLERSAAKVAMLRAGNAFLELFEFSAPVARVADPLRPCDRGYTHLALDIIDIDAELARLQAAGMRFDARLGDFGEIKAIYGKDPDGNVVELQEVRVPGHAYKMKA